MAVAVTLRIQLRDGVFIPFVFCCAWPTTASPIMRSPELFADFGAHLGSISGR